MADRAYPIFDRSRLKLLPLEERNHALTLRGILPLDARVPPFAPPDLAALAQRLLAARRKKRPVILMIGAHVIKRGCSRFLIEMTERGPITHVAVNGACAVHDFEFAMARNVARQGGRAIERFTSAVFDVQDVPADFRTVVPRRDRYLYYRPWKTILVRTVADGGRSYYFRGDHAVTIPNLCRLCLTKEQDAKFGGVK